MFQGQWKFPETDGPDEVSDQFETREEAEQWTNDKMFEHNSRQYSVVNLLN